MEPADTLLHPDRAGEEGGVGLDELPRLLCGQSGDREVPSLAQDVGGEVDGALAPDHVAAVAPQAALLLLGAVAPHRPLDDVAPDHQQAVEVVGVQELPRLVAPLVEGVVAYQLVDVEVRADGGQYLLACHASSFSSRISSSM